MSGHAGRRGSDSESRQQTTARECQRGDLLIPFHDHRKDSISWHSDDERCAALTVHVGVATDGSYLPGIARCRLTRCARSPTSFLGPLPCIASLSLGSSRDFQMKHKQAKEHTPPVPVEKWSLASGDCVVMRGTTQSKWLHSVPKRVNAGGRMNLTFRRAMNTAGTNK